MKIDAAKVKLRARIKEEVSAAVRVALEDPAVSRSSFLGPPAFETHAAYKAFRRKMLNANVWEDAQAVLAEDRFNDLLIRAFQRGDRAASDAAQFTLPGFEHLPRRIRVSKSSFALERATVGQLLVYADRYEKRAKRNVTMGDELTRLAGMVRDQPEDLTVAEALERASEGGKRKAAK